MKQKLNQLPAAVVEQLQGEKLAFVASSNAVGEIYATALSWLVAVDPGLIRFAISPKSPLMQNIREQPRISILVALPGHTLSIRGITRVHPEPIAGVPFPMARVDMEIDRVDDIMFYGGVVISEVKYQKTYSADLSQKLDTAVYQALRQAGASNRA